MVSKIYLIELQGEGGELIGRAFLSKEDALNYVNRLAVELNTDLILGEHFEIIDIPIEPKRR